MGSSRNKLSYERGIATAVGSSFGIIIAIVFWAIDVMQKPESGLVDVIILIVSIIGGAVIGLIVALPFEWIILAVYKKSDNLVPCLFVGAMLGITSGFLFLIIVYYETLPEPLYLTIAKYTLGGALIGMYFGNFIFRKYYKSLSWFESLKIR